MDNNLNNQAVVERRHGFTLVHHRDQVNVVSGSGKSVLRDFTRRWHKRDLAITIDHAALGIDPHLKAVACFTPQSGARYALATGNQRTAASQYQSP